MKEKAICVDFDGVLHRYSKGYHDGTAYDEPMPGAKKALSAIEEQGFEIIIHTSRPSWQVEEWLGRHGFKQYTIWQKPRALAYIDDRALRFTNWEDIKRYFIP